MPLSCRSGVRRDVSVTEKTLAETLIFWADRNAITANYEAISILRDNEFSRTFVNKNSQVAALLIDSS
jgi:hypothetical protein